MPVAGRVEPSSSRRRVFFVADASLHLINSARALVDLGSLSRTAYVETRADVRTDGRTCGRRLALAERRKIKTSFVVTLNGCDVDSALRRIHSSISFRQQQKQLLSVRGGADRGQYRP